MLADYWKATSIATWPASVARASHALGIGRAACSILDGLLSRKREAIEHNEAADCEHEGA